MIQSHVFLSVPKHFYPYSANLLAMHRCSHVVLFTIAVKVLDMLHYTLIPSHFIQVDIERLLFSPAVKWHNFWCPKIDKMVINSCTKCLISVKIAILTPHIIPLPLVTVWLYIRFEETCKLTLFTWYIFKDFFISLKSSNMQFEHAVLYVKIRNHSQTCLGQPDAKRGPLS